MNLKNNFYTIKSFCKTETGFDYTLALNSEHFIYQAHFPDNPITPGVCIIQMVKELVTDQLQQELFLKKIHNIKFLNVINPLEYQEVVFSISISPEEAGAYKVGAVVHYGAQVFAKMSVGFIVPTVR